MNDFDSFEKKKLFLSSLEKNREQKKATLLCSVAFIVFRNQHTISPPRIIDLFYVFLNNNIFVGYRDSSSNQLYVESKLQPIKNIGDYNQYNLRSPTMCSPANQCLKCQGDCDTDIDCIGNLLCKETESPRDVIPGCKDSNNNSGGTFGMRQSRRGGTSDYCYDVSITFVFKLV